MKYRIFLFFSLLCLISQNIIGQNCYSLPFSGTGIVSSGFDDLNSASCELRSSFPVEFQEDFSVYSISQYVISRYYGEEYWSQLVVEIDSIIGAQSPNYLLFIWSQNGDQLYSEGEVRLSLPKNGAFDCASDLKRESIRTQLQALLNESSTASNPLEYEQGELSAINSLKETVEYLVDCCDPQNRSSCSICMVSEEFDNMFDENMGKYSESLLINDPSPMVFHGNQVSEISGANYSIAVYDSITVTWEGGKSSPGSPNWNPPSSVNYAFDYPISGYASTPFGYGIPSGGGSTLTMNRVKVVYKKDGGVCKLLNMYPQP